MHVNNFSIPWSSRKIYHKEVIIGGSTLGHNPAWFNFITQFWWSAELWCDTAGRVWPWDLLRNFIGVGLLQHPLGPSIRPRSSSLSWSVNWNTGGRNKRGNIPWNKKNTVQNCWLALYCIGMLHTCDEEYFRIFTEGRQISCVILS